MTRGGIIICALAGLMAAAITVGAPLSARGATRAPITRTAKGMDDAHPIAVDQRLGRVFVADPAYPRGSVSVLDARTGGLVRTILVPMSPRAISIDEAANRVYVAGWVGDITVPGRLSILDAVSGRILHTVPVGANPQAPLIAARAHRVYVLNGGDTPTLSPGGVTMLDATSGHVLRTLDAGSLPLAGGVDQRTSRLFVVTSNGSEGAPLTLSMRDAASGRLLRALRLPPDANGPVALAIDERAGHLFVAFTSLIDTGYGSTVCVIDAKSGAIVHIVALRAPEIAGAGMRTSALSADAAMGRVYLTGYDVTTGAGRLTILDAGSGAVLRSAAIGRMPMATTMAPQAGVLLIADDGYNNGQAGGSDGLLELDARSGRVVHALDVVPWGMAVDGPAGRAFVLDANNNVTVVDLRSGRATGPLEA